MPRSARPALVLLLIAGFSLACAGGKKKDGDETEAIAQDPACADYLDCLAATSPEAVGAALEAYGEDGSCWTTASSAATCADACEQAMETVASAYPSEPACGGGSSAGDLDGTRWTFTEVGVDNPCGYPWGVVGVEGDIDTSGDAAFDLVGTVIAHDLLEGREALFDTTLSCTLSGRDFTCDEVELEAAGNYYSVVELTGTFGADYTTADATAVNAVKREGSVECEAFTTLDGVGG